jgi:hypothetical protein
MGRFPVSADSTGVEVACFQYGFHYSVSAESKGDNVECFQHIQTILGNHSPGVFLGGG